jgi:asparagine synthase (glutamine-hydrolysing)
MARSSRTLARMCGIGGILRTDGRPIPEEWLDVIDARIAYRGPDGAGRFRDRVEFVDDRGEKRIIEVAFVHRRLSIIDHADGAQPMVSERGRDRSEGLVAVVFNGCIYNHRELRAQLESSGHRFVTDHSDTEVLIHGWREWGEALPDHLEGMYAFAVWDRTNRRCTIARDRFGEKPLYYRATETVAEDKSSLFVPVFAFASNVGTLQHMPAPSKVCGDWCRGQWFLPQILLGYSPQVFHGPDLIDLSEAAPNSSTTFDALTRTDHWTWRDDAEGRDVDKPPSPTTGPAEQVPLEDSLERAVARRLEADVPLGCFLSGGVDSSLIAHFAKKHKPDLMTFTVRMPDPRYDESMHAEAVARHLGTNHHTLDVAMKPAEDLVHLIDLLGQPFGDSSILPAYWVSKAACEHVKVALAGDGGDELFIGYERYLAAPFLARHWRWLRFLPVSLLHRAHPKSRWSKLARLADMARDFPALGVRAMESLFTLHQLESLQPSIRPGRWACSIEEDHSVLHGLAAMRGPRRPIPPDQAIAELRDFDLEHYLPGDLLRKTDTASMACALEVRSPYLDRDLARAVLAMPIEQLIPGGERKGLLKQIARKYLPRECVDRPKMGFAIPIGEWFRDDNLPHRGAGMRTLLLDHLNSAEPFGPVELDRKGVQRFIDEHLSGKRDHSHRLFTLLTLSIWARSAAA